MMARAQEQIDQERVRWSDDEDRRLIHYMQTLQGRGEPVRWTDVPRGAGLMNRTWRSCKLRWTDFLDPDIRRGPFSEEEKATIIELQKEYGNDWATIARQTGKTKTDVKNFWYSCEKKLKKTDPQVCTSWNPDEIGSASLEASKANPYSASTSTITFEGWPELLMDNEPSDKYCSDDISLYK